MKEDLIDPSDMLHYDAVSKTMKISKQRKIYNVLKQYLQRTLENIEIQLTTDEDGQYYADITISRHILRDILKCIKESNCDPAILEEHLQNIHFKLKTEDDKNPQLLEVVIFLYIIFVFLDLVMNYTLKDWLACIKTPVCRFYQACEKIFHRKEHLQIQQCPQEAEENVCFGVQEVPIANIQDEGPRVELNQNLSSNQSPEIFHRRSKSNTDAFNNSEIDREQLLKQPKGPKDYKGSKSSTALPKPLENDNLQEDSDELSSGETFTDSTEEEMSDSPSFVVLKQEEQEDS